MQRPGSRLKPGPNRVNAVQMCLFDTQLSIEAVEQALALLVQIAHHDRRPAVAEAVRIVREQRRKLRDHNAELARLLAA